MRWEWERAGEVVRAVRAVDTATHPEFQGRGIFSRLTLAALPELASDGVQFVFNTPNDQSRPGYLKMGWQEIGRARACVRPLSLPGAVRLARSRTPAAHWSEPASFGLAATEVLGAPELAALLATRPRSDRFRTHVDAEFLAWRYGTPLLGYRAVPGPGGLSGGVAFVRIRRRGRAREAAVAAVLAPGGGTRAVAALMAQVRRAVRRDADYVLGVGRLPGCVAVPALGPVVTSRDLAVSAPQAVEAFDLCLGDVELF
jgi:hypothetical protein